MSRITNEVSERVAGEWSLLQHQWGKTAEQWQDDVRNAFEQEFWKPHAEAVPAALIAIRQLEE